MSEWIKCSDRLPENSRAVLGTYTYHGETEVGTVRLTEKFGYKVWVLYYDWNTTVSIDKVVAWMPLPEPYDVV